MKNPQNQEMASQRPEGAGGPKPPAPAPPAPVQFPIWNPNHERPPGGEEPVHPRPEMPEAPGTREVPEISPRPPEPMPGEPAPERARG